MSKCVCVFVCLCVYVYTTSQPCVAQPRGTKGRASGGMRDAGGGTGPCRAPGEGSIWRGSTPEVYQRPSQAQGGWGVSSPLQSNLFCLTLPTLWLNRNTVPPCGISVLFCVRVCPFLMLCFFFFIWLPAVAVVVTDRDFLPFRASQNCGMQRTVIIFIYLFIYLFIYVPIPAALIGLSQSVAAFALTHTVHSFLHVLSMSQTYTYTNGSFSMQ